MNTKVKSKDFSKACPAILPKCRPISNYFIGDIVYLSLLYRMKRFTSCNINDKLVFNNMLKLQEIRMNIV